MQVDDENLLRITALIASIDEAIVALDPSMKSYLANHPAESPLFAGLDFAAPSAARRAESESHDTH